MKRGLIGSLLAAAFATMLIACGGSGGGSKGTLSLTGRSVQSMQWRSLVSMANGGLPMPPFMWFGGEGGTTGGTTGTTGGSNGGGGYPSMGGFVRNFGGPNGMAARSRIAEGTSGTTGSEGTTGTTGGDGSDFYYDSWLGLWVAWEMADNSVNMDFFADEGKTQPAGFMHSSFTGQWDSFPNTYNSEYSYTAGLLAGAHGVYTWTETSEFTGSLTYDDTYADGSTDHGTSQWTEEGSSWSSDWHSPNNTTWYQDSGTWVADGGGTFTASNSAGWATTWVYNADWSGHAHFEGPDPKLPADMTWTADGHYHIQYADGSHEDWDWSDFWDDESGTTGEGTSSTGSTGG